MTTKPPRGCLLKSVSFVVTKSFVLSSVPQVSPRLLPVPRSSVHQQLAAMNSRPEGGQNLNGNNSGGGGGGGGGL